MAFKGTFQSLGKITIPSGASVSAPFDLSAAIRAVGHGCNVIIVVNQDSMDTAVYSPDVSLDGVRFLDWVNISNWQQTSAGSFFSVNAQLALWPWARIKSSVSVSKDHVFELFIGATAAGALVQ